MTVPTDRRQRYRAPRRGNPRRRTRRQRRHSVAFWLVAAAFCVNLAFSAVPTPLYVIYQQRDHFSTLMITVVYAVYAIGVIGQPVPRRPRLGLGGTAPGAGARARRQRAERGAVHRRSQPAGPHHRAGHLRRVDRAHHRDRDRVPGRTAPGRGRVADRPASASGGDGVQPRRDRGRAARRRAARAVRAVAAGDPLRDLRRGACRAGAADRLRAGDGDPAGPAAGLAAAAGGDTRACPRHLLRRHRGRGGGVRGLRRLQLPHARLPGRHHARDLIRGRGRRRLLRVRRRGGRADRARHRRVSPRR